MTARAIRVESELIDLYEAESKLPRLVVAAFLSHEQEPPSRDRVDRVGYTAAEAAIIAPFLSSPDPVEV